MDVLMKSISSVIAAVLEFLPDSPFRAWLDNLSDIPYLGYLNYFIPISDFVALLTAWGIAVGAFYAVSAILRMVKAIE